MSTVTDEEGVMSTSYKSDNEGGERSPCLPKCLSSKPTGYCLIIDNSSISKQARCLPVNRLCHILREQFNFITLYFSSLSLDSIELLLKTLSHIDQSDSSCSVNIMINTSKEGVVNGTDGRSLLTKDVMEFLSDKNCPSLADKPKVFLFQTVSIDQRDDKVKLTCTQPTAVQYPYLPSLLEMLRTYSDSATTGSIFVNSSQTSLTNTQLKQAFVLPTHSMEMLSGRYLQVELVNLLEVFLPIRAEVIRILAESESLIIKTCQDIYTNKLVGGTGGVAGTIFTVTGLALIPVTLGISLILTGIGAGIGAAGGITALISNVTDSVAKGDLMNLKYLMELDSQLCQCVNSIRERLSSLAVQEKDMFEQLLQKSSTPDTEDFNSKKDNLVESMDLVEVVTRAYKQLNNKDVSAISWLKELTRERKKEFECIKSLKDYMINQ